MNIKTRFAPSPTGDLHVGSTRTALYAYLYAKKHQGEFILRIEDTDRERSTQAAVDVILNGMAWLGLHSDVEPIYQTARLARYREVADQLLADGLAYRCTMSKDELDAMRAAQTERGEKPRYDRSARDKNLPETDEPHVIRFKNPLSGTVKFDDAILGEIAIDNEELDDFILIRSDGMPTYNFAVVIDDMDMAISHVIRGNDHVNNTVRQINLYEALNAKPPIFAHIPMIAGEDGKKLSKRHGAVSVLHYRDEGYLPQALLNYLVRLGWSHGDQEIFSLDEMIEKFDFNAVSKSPAIFDYDKLNWLNQHYLKTLSWDELESHVTTAFARADIGAAQGPSIQEVFMAYRDRAATLKELAESAHCYYIDAIAFGEEAANTHLVPDAVAILNAVHDELAQLGEWEKDGLKQAVKSVVKTLGVKFPQVGLPLRVALTGGTSSPGIDQTLVLVGRERSLSRIKAAIKFAQSA